MIISAASAGYGPSLLAWLGSLQLNWPGHPEVLVYDVGLDEATRAALERHGTQVRIVPPFCRHWRQHYTWKLWCLHDAPASRVFWMDAGTVVLRPLDEVFDAIDAQGCFFTTNRELLDWEASEDACHGCGVSPEFRLGRPSLAAGVMGFRKTGVMRAIVEEALAVGCVERHIAATTVAHRHDQTIISLLCYKHLGRVPLADPGIYLGSLLPNEVPAQKIWVHRRRMLPADMAHFAAHVSTPGMPYLPTPPCSIERARALAHLYRVYWCFGQDDRDAAARHLEEVFKTDATLRSEPALIARQMTSFAGRLRQFGRDTTIDGTFADWAVRQLEVHAGSFCAWLVAASVGSSQQAFEAATEVAALNQASRQTSSR